MGPRPVGVTIVGILIVIGGIFSIIGGFLGFFSGQTLGWGVVGLIVSIIVGLIYLLVAKGIFNGNAGSRLVVAIITVIGFIGDFFMMFSNFGSALISVIWGIIILALLYAGKAKAFFG